MIARDLSSERRDYLLPHTEVKTIWVLGTTNVSDYFGNLINQSLHAERALQPRRSALFETLHQADEGFAHHDGDEATNELSPSPPDEQPTPSWPVNERRAPLAHATSPENHTTSRQPVVNYVEPGDAAAEPLASPPTLSQEARVVMPAAQREPASSALASRQPLTHESQEGEIKAELQWLRRQIEQPLQSIQPSAPMSAGQAARQEAGALRPPNTVEKKGEPEAAMNAAPLPTVASLALDSVAQPPAAFLPPSPWSGMPAPTAPQVFQSVESPPSVASPAVERVVNVTIGRLEVRALTPAPLAKRTAAPAASPAKLDDYLRQRNGGRR